MNIDIKKIRKKLDKLDVKLLHIIKERSLLVDQVVKLKKKKRRSGGQTKNKIYSKENKRKIYRS
jgi:chorismate mutase